MSDIEQLGHEPAAGPDYAAAQRLAAIVESSDDAIISKNLDGIVLTWNQSAERIFGYRADEAIGKPITIVIPPALQDQEPLILKRIAKGERIDWFETERQRKDGSRFPVSLTISPVRDHEGHIVGASKIARDITNLRKSLEQQELLLREMSHRVKNVFAVANGVVSLSSRSTDNAKELTKIIQSRLSALSRAHDLILPRKAGTNATTSFADLVRTVLAPYESEAGTITIDGPDIACGDGAATSFALLLHEFATNAIKYGGLSEADGKVRITWTVSQGTFVLKWTETHEMKEPAGKAGFGSYLVDAAARTMSGEVSRGWSDGKMTITLRVPIEHLKL